jgi:hypothetical protein
MAQPIAPEALIFNVCDLDALLLLTYCQFQLTKKLMVIMQDSRAYATFGKTLKVA